MSILISTFSKKIGQNVAIIGHYVIFANQKHINDIFIIKVQKNILFFREIKNKIC